VENAVKNLIIRNVNLLKVCMLKNLLKEIKNLLKNIRILRRGYDVPI